MSYVVGSFNVRNLNFATKENNKQESHVKRAYSDIGRIIQENFDIVALQEVLSPNVAKQIFSAASGWEYCWKQSMSKSDDSREGLMFAWNSRRLRPVVEPEIWKQYKQDPELGKRGLLRHPCYGRFTPVDTVAGGPFCEIRLLNTHIRFDPCKTTESAMGAGELRRRELKILTEQILHRLKTKRYGDNRPAYTFLMGDYNLELKRNGYHGPYLDEFAVVNDPQGQVVYTTVQDQRSTLSRRTYIDETGKNHSVYNGYSHNYDHFTYDRNDLQMRGVETTQYILNAVQTYRNGDFEKFFLEISDHVPIALKIDFK